MRLQGLIPVPPVALLLPALLLLLPAATATDTYVHPDSGRDSHPGSIDAPLQTIQACVDSIRRPGDRCLLKAGVYPMGGAAPVRVTDKAGEPNARVAIAAAGDGAVVLDGTVAVDTLAPPDTSAAGGDGRSGRWRHAPEVGKGVYALALRPGTEVTQLFAGHASADAADTLQMLVPARWPNARWDDRTMFQGPEHWAHAGPPFGGGEPGVSILESAHFD
jgi:hypothetical protein